MCILLACLFKCVIALEFTVCNCNKPTLKGIIDLEDPKFCIDHQEQLQVRTILYTLYVKKPKEWVTKGYSCMQWEKEKQIVGYFFGSYDTTYTTAAKEVSPEECRRTVQYPYRCGNFSIERNNGVYSFEGNPFGEGSWMKINKYRLPNCISMEFQVTKECRDCPVMSPFGKIADNSSLGFAVHGHTTYIWTDFPEIDDKEDQFCGFVPVHQGKAKIILPGSNRNGKVIDETRQLEFFIKPMTHMCSQLPMRVFPIEGVPDAFIAVSINNRTRRDATTLKPVVIGKIKLESTNLCITVRANDVILADCISGPSIPTYHQSYIFKPNANLRREFADFCLNINSSQMIRLENCQAKQEVNTLWEFDIGNNEIRVMVDSHLGNRTIVCLAGNVYFKNITVSKCNRNNVDQRWKIIPSTRNWDPLHSIEDGIQAITFDKVIQTISFDHSNETVSPPVNNASLASDDFDFENYFERKIKNVTKVTYAEVLDIVKNMTKVSDVEKSPLLNVTDIVNSTIFQHVQNITDNPKIKEIISRIFLSKHETFWQDKSLERENELATEIKQVYCSSVVTNKLALLALVQTSGILAASTLFPKKTCSRLQGMGQIVLFQQCLPETVKAGHILTKCGNELIIAGNRTVGRDGFSVHDFSPCFWPEGIVNINGKAFEFRDGNWIERKPTIHFHYLKLLDQFKEIKDRNYDYLIPPKTPYDNRGVESLNVLTEMVARITQTNVNSLDAVIMDEAAKSNFWDGWKWIHRLKWAVSGLLSLVVTAPIIYAAVRCIPFSRLMVAIPKLKFRRKSRKHPEAVELQPTNNPDARPPGYNEVPLHSHVTTRYVPNIGIVWNDDCLALPIENSPK